MKKFKYAFNGLKNSLKEKAVLIQFVLALLAIIGGIIIKLDEYEWLAFLICIGLVICLEIINSCIERLCDLYTKEYDDRIKVIKDYASGAVLFASIISLVVCIIVVLRRII